MATKFVNEVTLTLHVSKSTDKRAAVRKVSDKLVTLSCYLPTGKDKDGNYKPAINFTVNAFTGGAKTQTQLGVQPNAGDLINVTGSLDARGFETKDGKKGIEYIINASSINKPEEVADASPSGDDNPWGDSGSDAASENPWE